MVIELVTLTVHSGQEQAFEVAMAEARKLLLAAAGAQQAVLARGVENPSKYILQVEWDSVDAHVAFTRTEGIARFRALVGAYFAERPQMEHFSPVT